MFDNKKLLCVYDYESQYTWVSNFKNKLNESYIIWSTKSINQPKHFDLTCLDSLLKYMLSAKLQKKKKKKKSMLSVSLGY